jgi:hypothetical protein
MYIKALLYESCNILEMEVELSSPKVPNKLIILQYVVSRTTTI